MVIVTVGRDSVTLKLEGSKKLFALKSKVTIPLSNISTVSTEQVRLLWLPRARIGAHLPGVFMAGTFWLKSGKTFYYVKDPAKCITLHLNNHEYSKVSVQVDDKEAVAARIRAALG